MNKIIIAKPGFNALTETDPNNLIFDSDFNTLKYHTSGVVNQTFDFADYYASDVILGTTYYSHRKVDVVAHNLGYIPFFVAYVEGFGGADTYCMTPGFFQDFVYYTYCQAYADATNLYFVSELHNDSNSGTGSETYIYKIFKNNLNL